MTASPQSPPPEALTLARLDAIIEKFRAREEMGVGSWEFGELLALARRAIRYEQEEERQKFEAQYVREGRR